MPNNFRGAMVLVAGVASVALAYACTGDDPDIGAVAPESEGGTTVIINNGNDGSSGGDNDGSTAGDAPLVCTAPEVACDGKCVLLTESKDHCGRCGRSCGGGTCDKGVCPNVGVVSNIQEIGGFSVSDGYVYYATNNQAVESTALIRCSTGGCTPKETLFSSNALAANINAVTASKDIVSFTYSQGGGQFEIVRACPGDGGCVDGGYQSLSNTNNNVFAAANKKFYFWGGKLKQSVTLADCTAFPTCTNQGFGEAQSGIAADETRVVFQRYDGGVSEVVICDVPSGCDGGAVHISDTVPEQATIHAGVMYTRTSGIMGQASGKFSKCTLPCTSGSTDVVTTILYPTDFVVDASGIYWIAPLLDQIRHCPLAGGCGAGNIVAEGLGPSPGMLQTDNGFVYWVSTADTDAGPRSNITRIAKP